MAVRRASTPMKSSLVEFCRCLYGVRADGCSPTRDRRDLPWPHSECRRRAGADHLARLGADAAETVRPAALEIIGVAGPEDAAFAVDRHFQPARENDPAFFAIMHQRDASGVAAGLVTLFQYLQRAAEQIVADLKVRDRPLADLAQLVGTIKRLARPVGFEGEEFRHSHRDTVQDALQRADGRVHL